MLSVIFRKLVVLQIKIRYLNCHPIYLCFYGQRQFPPKQGVSTIPTFPSTIPSPDILIKHKNHMYKLIIVSVETNTPHTTSSKATSSVVKLNPSLISISHVSFERFTQT